MKQITIFSIVVTFVMAMSFQTIGQTIEFEDDFESGSANWEVTGTWDLTDAHLYSPTHSMTDSPGGDYSTDQDTYCTMANGVDLSDPTILSARVSFWAIYDIETSIDFDWIKVQASDDDFATLAELGIFNGEGNLDPWIEYSYSLGAFIGSDNVKVRFYFHSDGGYEVDGIYFDDFIITSSDIDNAPPYIGYDNPPTFYEGSLDDYVFMAQLIDASGIESAKVNYQVEGGDWLAADAVNITGDDYEFTIPTQNPGAIVVFNVEATDASASSNTSISDNFTYIAGDYIYYDDPEVTFYTTMLAGDGAAVVFSIENQTQIVTGLIRNYQDQSLPENGNFMFHVWDSGPSGPGEDLITPFEVTPAASPADPNPMTVIDLRPYADELSMLPGDVFMGITIPSDDVNITMVEPAANRSFTLVSGAWELAAYDFHFRMITTGGGVGIDDNTPKVLESILVFPNPATDILYIDSKNEILNLNVVNTTGQLVYSVDLNLQKTQLDISRLQAGIYFVQVETENGISTQKIIVK